jgi:uncharacterized protein (DUF58 family)
MKGISLQEASGFGSLELLARQVVEGFITGMHKSPFHGFSVEFSEHRLYNKGESTRHIDWKLYGRTDRLYVKRYEEETNLRCQVVLDISDSMRYPLGKSNKLAFSVYATAALYHLMKSQRDAFGLTLFSDKITRSFNPKSSSHHYQILLAELERLLQEDSVKKAKSEHEKEGTAIADILHEIAETAHRRSMIVVFSDFFDTGANLNKLQDALNHLRYNQHEVLVFHVMDRKTELDFNFPNQPTLFVDLESGKEIKLNPSSIKEFYQKQAYEFQQQLMIHSGQSRIDYIPSDIEEGFRQILERWLLKRQGMF